MGDDDNLRWHIGSVLVTRVPEVVVPLDATVLIPAFTPDHLAQHRSWLVPSFFTDDGRLRLSVHTFIVESGTTTIVVDTCVGEGGDRPLPSDSSFPSRLDDAIDGGLAGVDMVLCTHLHFDHVGWNTHIVGDERVPTFPNARYLFGRTELDHLDLDDHMAVREPSVQPLLDAGLVDAVDSDHELTPQVRLVPTPGHTPGHVSVLIESQQQRALITGDMTHTPLQFAHPELPAGAFDWDSDMSTATREAAIAAHADTDTIVLGTHFAPPTAGRIRRHGGGTWFEVIDQ